VLPLLLAPLLALSGPWSAPAQPQAGAGRAALAIVLDPRGRPIVDLGLDDFVIQEGDAPREVFGVRMADYPVAVLVDTSRDAGGDLPDIRRAVSRFVGRLGRRPIALGTLGDPPVMLTAFGDERQRLLAAIDALSAGSSSSTLVLEGAALAAARLRETRAPFSAIVLLSAAPDAASRTAPDEAVAALVGSRTIVHAIVRGAAAGPLADPGPRRLAEILRSVSRQTHGEYAAIYSSVSYQAALDRLADRLASEMMIEYIVPPGSSAADVRIGVRVPGARVRGLGVTP